MDMCARLVMALSLLEWTVEVSATSSRYSSCGSSLIRCVDHSCKCYYNGEVYNSGDGFASGCIVCRCVGGTMICSGEYCDCPRPVVNTGTQVNVPSMQFGDTATYSCAQGYHDLDGSTTRICQDDRTWSGAPPTCSIIDCGQPHKHHSTSVSVTSNYYGGIATYSCISQYAKLDGQKVRYCRDNGEWSGSKPVCVETDCGIPDSHSSTEVQYSSTDVNSVAYYNCKDGYEGITVVERRCQGDGDWSGTAPECTLVPSSCSYPDSHHSTNVQVSSMLVDSVATYTCKEGYEGITTPVERTCLSTGEWSDDAPACTPIPSDCGVPEVDDSTHVVYTTTTEDSEATYTCKDGYEGIDGEIVRTCEATGEWSGIIPTCTPIPAECGAPDHDYTTEVSYTTTTEGSIATYTCKTGYEGSTPDRICQDDGLWSGTTPVCTPIPTNCGDPSAHESTNVQFDSTTEGSEAYYTCKTGYEGLETAFVRTCQTTGFWSGTAPECSLVNPGCGEPDFDSSTNVEYSATTVGSIAHYSCKEGYAGLYGDDDRTCLSNGSWSGELPTCPPIGPYSGQCTQADRCTKHEHDFVRYKLKLGSNCRSFCQCAPLTTNPDGSTEYYWQEMPCGAGTQWNGMYGPNAVCDHEANVHCMDEPYDGQCTATDHCTKWQYENVQHRMMFGTECGSYCICTQTDADTYTWVKHQCSTGSRCRGFYGRHAECVTSAFTCNDVLLPP